MKGDKLICFLILLADFSSRMGKDKNTHWARKYYYYPLQNKFAKIIKNANIFYYNINHPYMNKDWYIGTALRLIDKSRKSNFRYYIGYDKNTIGYPYIIYFNFRVNGQKMQCSFHSSYSFNRYNRKNTYKTEWDKKSSTAAIMAAARAYNI